MPKLFRQLAWSLILFPKPVVSKKAEYRQHRFVMLTNQTPSLCLSGKLSALHLPLFTHATLIGIMKPKRAPLQQLSLKKGIANNGKIDIAKLWQI